MSKFLLSPLTPVRRSKIRNPSPSFPSHTYSRFNKYCSSWANNCLAINTTNGAKLEPPGNAAGRARTAHVAHPIHPKMTADIPQPVELSLSGTSTSAPSGVESHILPGNETGVVRASCYCPVLHIINYSFRAILAVYWLFQQRSR